jgi:stage III sporulation protein AA
MPITKERRTQMKGIVKNNMFNVLSVLPDYISSNLEKIYKYEKFDLEELRIRAKKPLVVEDGLGKWFLSNEGTLTRHIEQAIYISELEVRQVVEMICRSSIYAYQSDIKNGFITLNGGHRIGICGKVIVKDMAVSSIKDISAINIRIAKEVKGCGQNVLNYMMKSSEDIYSTLLISPPQCGKTTIIRDVARLLASIGTEGLTRPLKVGIVDERSEIAACFEGIPQNDLGIMSDVLDGCPKTVGIFMLIRSMSPEVVVTDEVGGMMDIEALRYASNAGVKIIASAHGYGISDNLVGQGLREILDSNIFERFIVFSRRNGPGTIENIYDEFGNSLFLLR